MKAGEVLKLANISRKHLSRLVKQGKFKVTVISQGNTIITLMMFTNRYARAVKI